MRWLISIVFLGLVSPTTAPTLDESTKSTVQKLMAQLGAEGFKDRESASNELIKMGPRILPLLREGKPNDDPEIDNRLRLIVKQLEADSSPHAQHAQGRIAAVPLMLDHLAGHKPGVIAARNPAAGQVELSARYEKDSVTMLRSAKGIEIRIECTINGNLTREMYRADSEADLFKQFPAAYKLHESLLSAAGYGEDRRWWRQFAAKAEPATRPAAR
ncbi:MAG TPA: hypothetical protein VGP99_10015 [Tepidisphaeraceae bacterium]|jgi:hypothetical protein|nr:hypothetical protein [Tepidisphaeraceae bacterium]